MSENKQLFTPAEAADYLTEALGRKITVNRVAQLRRAGRIEGTQIGYNTTVYTRENLEKAVESLSKKQDEAA